MNDKTETTKYEIPQEIKDKLESPIPEDKPIIEKNWKFWVRVCCVPLVIVLFVYVNFFGKPEYLRNSTWVFEYQSSPDKPIHYMVWDFDESGELIIANVMEDRWGEDVFTYKIKGNHRVSFKGKDQTLILNGVETYVYDGSFSIELNNVTCIGYPINIRYPKDEDDDVKYQYLQNVLNEYIQARNRHFQPQAP